LITDFFNSSAVVQQLTNTKTAMGSLKKSYTSRIASLPCRLSGRIFSETDEFGKMTSRRGWRLYCEANSTNRAIEESDRITLSGHTYEIKAIHNPGNLNRHLQIDLAEVE